MKKFLLIVVAAFAAANVSAANGVKKANFPKAQKAMVAPDAHLGILSKSLNAAMQAMSEQKAEMSAKTIQKAPDASELIPCYAEETGMYLPSFGFVDQFMYDGASYLVQDGKAYFAPFANLGMVEGVVEAGVQNMYSVLGADSITFTCSSIAELTATGEKLYLEPCDWADYTAVRMDGAKTFGAYYFAEYGELYVPEILALFVEEPMEKNPFSHSYVLYPLDLMPQSLYAEYTSKATASALELWGQLSFSTDKAIAVFGDNCVYVKGAEMEFNPDAWMRFAVDENDESLYTVSALQGYTSYTYKSNPAIWVMVGATHDGSSVSGFTGASITSSPVSFKWVDNADETSTLSILDNQALGNYVISSEADGVKGLGFYESYANMTINITYESIIDDGINEVKGNKQQNDAIYNIAGQRVAKDYKGLVIKNGKKYLVK